MVAVELTAVVGEDRRLVIDLPDEIPTGPVVLVIRPAPAAIEGVTDREALRAAREAAREKLRAAGRLATNPGLPENLKPLSDEELAALVHLPPGAGPSEALIDEDRGPR